MSQLKWKLSRWLRRIGLLPAVNYVRYLGEVRRTRRANREFLASAGPVCPPPSSLAYDAYGHTDWRVYFETGLQHARFLGGLIQQHTPAGPLEICEWGCGPARVIRHFPAVFGDRPITLCGADYNPRTVAWCRQHIEGIEFRANGLLPPLPFESNQWDVVYALSVFTHLSEKAHFLWIDELWRVVKDSGIVIFTTQGDGYLKCLLPEEQELYRADRLVVRSGVQEGKMAYSAFHPPAFVRDRLLERGAVVAHLPSPVAHGLLQDCWVARKNATSVA